MAEQFPHWSSDDYWVNALDKYYQMREQGIHKIEIDFKEIEKTLFNGGSPAYKMVDAMCSVNEHEGMDGLRGAPRLVLALLAILSESDADKF